MLNSAHPVERQRRSDEVAEPFAGEQGFANLGHPGPYLSNVNETTSAGSVGVPMVNAMYCLPLTM